MFLLLEIFRPNLFSFLDFVLWNLIGFFYLSVLFKDKYKQKVVLYGNF